MFNGLRALVLSARLLCLLGHDDHETLEHSTLANCGKKRDAAAADDDGRDEPLLAPLCAVYICVHTYPLITEYDVYLPGTWMFEQRACMCMYMYMYTRTGWLPVPIHWVVGRWL